MQIVCCYVDFPLLLMATHIVQNNEFFIYLLLEHGNNEIGRKINTFYGICKFIGQETNKNLADSLKP